MSSYPKRKVNLPKPPPPRDLETIKKEHAEMSFRAGNASYQIYVYQKELENLNQALLRLNQEGAARNELDAKEAKTEVTSV